MILLSKAKQIATSKIGVAVITGFICFNFGGIIATDTETPKKLERVEEELRFANAKLNEAKPWFDMTEQQKEIEAKKLEQEKAKLEAEAKAKAEADKKAEIEARTVELSNGNYTAGKDFKEGAYDIIAVSGSGNVTSSNMFSGGINAMMSDEASNFGDLYEQEYKNINLPKDATLSIDGVKIKLVPRN